MTNPIDRFWNELTPDQQDDVERFETFWIAWPQGEANFDPDEWWRAEQVRDVAHRILGIGKPVRYWAEWIRANELYEALKLEEGDTMATAPQPDPKPPWPQPAPDPDEDE